MIAVLDYGSGNVKAFLNAYERMKVPCRAARSAADVDGATRIILPGVGAFDTAMAQFERSGMRSVVETKVFKEGVPILGICVGMQMLAGGSDEGTGRGLGWIGGHVRRLAAAPSAGPLRLPHMGWNQVARTVPTKLLADLPEGGRFYFLHSYFFECSDEGDVIATADYGRVFPCAIKRNNIHAVQFHPEKSHEDGMQLLKNFSIIPTAC